jgi:uncharacterized protein (TIGR02145 family)
MKKILQNFTLIAILLFVLLLSNSCKKDDDKSNNSIPITVTDIDGNVYHTVTIGTQVWMVENLKTTKYRNGTAIPNVTDNAAWGLSTTGAYCDYNNTPSNSATYGRLYNWDAVNTDNLCPIGWHVPTDAEWITLISHLGGESIASGKLKEVGLTHWNYPNTAATNETGFSALPGGSLEFSGGIYRYEYIGSFGKWWSSTQVDPIFTWIWSMTYDDSNATRRAFDNNNGFSVRCIKD